MVVEGLIADAVEALRARHDVRAVGVAAAGFVDAAGARVRFAPHLSWRDEPLRDRLGARLGLPVLVANDANAALWGEARFGAARGADHVLMVTLGTGIGGALLVGGRLHTGRNGMAGEFGHMRVVPDGRPCECGHTGCWEQYCSGKALARFAREAGSAAVGPALTEAASHGEPVAPGAFAEVGRWLGVGLADLVAAFDPDLVLVGGGVSAAGELLLEPARRTFAEALVGQRPPQGAEDPGRRPGSTGRPGRCRRPGRPRRGAAVVSPRGDGAGDDLQHPPGRAPRGSPPRARAYGRPGRPAGQRGAEAPTPVGS